MNSINQRYSDYTIFVDESGDYSLESINEKYPLFVLLFCIFEKQHYSEKATAALRNLKFATFGHELVVLHEREIRKKTGAFSEFGKEERENFLSALTELIAQMEFKVIAVVIDKRQVKLQRINLTHAYHFAMRLGLESAYRFLQLEEQHIRDTHIIFEARGRKEDTDLELEFRRVCAGANSLHCQLPFKIVVADKKANSEGLQFADLIARPIGLSVLDPAQSNRAYAVLEEKIFALEGINDLMKAKGPRVVPEAQTPVG